MWITFIYDLGMIIQMMINIIKWVPFVIFVKTLQVEDSLPELDETNNLDTTRKYHIEENQTFTIQCSPQSSIIGKLYEECHLHEPYIKMDNLLSINFDNSDERKYLYSSLQKGLYIISSTQLIFQSFGKPRQRTQLVRFDGNCSKEMIFDQERQKIFIFSCEAVYEITISNYLKHQVLRHQSNLDIRSAARFQDLIIVTTYQQGIFIYAVDIQESLIQLKSPIDTQTAPQIVGVHYSDNQLAVLDKNKGLILYKRLQNYFTYQDSLILHFQEEVQYTALYASKNAIFLSISAETQIFVVQLQLIGEKIYLVRYYKGYYEIFKMEVLNNTLVILSDSKVDIFPINRDPRAIKQLFNGYSYSHDQSLLLFNHLEKDQYLLIKPRTVTLSTWSLLDKKIQCDFKEPGVYNIMIEKPCFQKTQGLFTSTCSQIQNIEIAVYHKDAYIWLVLICLGAFITTVLLLIYWREIKMAKIVHILKQIRGFEVKKKQIQFKEVHFNSNEVARQRKWDELGEQKEQKQQVEAYEQYLSERNNLN